MLQPGDVLKDTYRVEALHARGGMALVYRVVHIELNVTRALKILQPQYCQDLACVARFRKEAQLMAQFHHPNVAQVFDFGTTPEGYLYLVMEWLEGEDLSQYRKRHPRPPYAFVLQLCQQVGAALATSHRLGVVHRDLKPANIFLTAPVYGEALGDPAPPNSVLFKVVDFGIARLLQRSDDSQQPEPTRPGMVLGTPGYMAPEQLMTDLGPVGPAYDQFALAVIAYELLIGDRLFVPGGRDVGALFALAHQVLNRPLPPLPADVPEVLPPALTRALRYQPSERFPSVSEFVDSLTAPVVPTVSTMQPGGPVSSTNATVPDAPMALSVPRWQPLIIAWGLAALCIASGLWTHSLLTDKRPAAHPLNWHKQVDTPRPSVWQPPIRVIPSTLACEPKLRSTLIVNVLGGDRVATTRTGGRPVNYDRIVLDCIQRLALDPFITKDLLLQRSGSLMVVTPFPKAKQHQLENCLEQAMHGIPVPQQVRIHPVFVKDKEAPACRDTENGSTSPVR